MTPAAHLHPRVPLGTPVITDTTTSSTVTLSWPVVNGNPTAYDVRRKTNGGDYGTLVQLPSSTSCNVNSNSCAYTNGGLVPSTAYVYQVRAVRSPFTSSWSAPDLATTTFYTHSSAGNHVTAGEPISAVDITELRTVVNSVRATAGFSPPYSYTYPDLSNHPVIHFEDISELRAAVDQARTSLGLPAAIYTNQPLDRGHTTVKAAHINELRDGVQ